MMKKTNSPPKLTDKQSRFVQYKLRGLNNKEAAIQAGYSEKTAQVQASEVIRRPEVIEALGWTLEQLGITYQSVAEPIALALKATRRVNIGTKEDPEYLEEPDLNMRLRAAAIAWKMLEDRRKGNDTPESPFGMNPGFTLNPPGQTKLNDMDEVELQKIIFRSPSN